MCSYYTLPGIYIKMQSNAFTVRAAAEAGDGVQGFDMVPHLMFVGSGPRCRC